VLLGTLIFSVSAYANVATDTLGHQETIQALQQTIVENFIATPEGDSINNIQIKRPTNNQNFEFFVMLLLIAIPAIFKFVNPVYFNNIFTAFRNPNLSARQLKDQLSQNSLASLVMDSYFCFVFATYTFYIIKYRFPAYYQQFDNELLLLSICTLGFGVIYVFKYLFLKTVGWVIKQEDITNSYSFNIFLINKILAITLLPFILVIAFGQGPWVKYVYFASFAVIVIAFIQRYLRSGALFSNLLKYSKFHFFLYLCASELVPFAVFGKAISQYLVK